MIAASLFAVLLIVLTLVAAIWGPSNHGVLIWGAGLVIQFFFLALLDNARFQYENIKYIETTLRPLIEPLVDQSSPFWRYEYWLSGQRRGVPQWWEYTPAIGAAVTIIAAAVGRLFDLAQNTKARSTPGAFTALDWVGLAANIVCLGAIIYYSVRIVALRRSIFQ
jgi:hypothetical protein